MSQAGIASVTLAYPSIATSYVTDSGTAIPASNTINVIGGSGIVTSGSGSTVTITSSASVIWQTTSSSGTLSVDNGYVCIAPGGALSLALPAVSSVGDFIAITLDGATSWTVTQGAGQQIRFGNLETTSGAGGSLASTDQGDTIRMVCSVANTRWNVIDSIGNITVV